MDTVEIERANDLLDTYQQLGDLEISYREVLTAVDDAQPNRFFDFLLGRRYASMDDIADVLCLEASGVSEAKQNMALAVMLAALEVHDLVASKGKKGKYFFGLRPFGKAFTNESDVLKDYQAGFIESTPEARAKLKQQLGLPV